MPSSAILAIKQCEPLVVRMGNENPKALAGAGGGRRLGFRHLLCRSAARSRVGKVAGGRADALAARSHIIIDRIPLLDFAVKFEPAKSRLVHPRLMVAVGHPGGQ